MCIEQTLIKLAPWSPNQVEHHGGRKMKKTITIEIETTNRVQQEDDLDRRIKNIIEEVENKCSYKGRVCYKTNISVV